MAFYNTGCHLPLPEHGSLRFDYYNLKKG